MNRTIAIGLALALTACGGPITWYKEGATQDEFNKAKYDCMRDAYALGGVAYQGFGVTERTGNAQIYLNCLIARGFTPRRG